MELFVKFVLLGFLLMYSIKTLVNAFNVLYYIACDVNEKQKEEEDKKIIDESVKRLYS